MIFYISIRYNRFLKNNFSDIDNKTVGWVRGILLAFIIWYLAWGFVLSQDNKWYNVAYYTFLIVVWAFIYRYSTKHITAFHTQEMFTHGKEKVVSEPSRTDLTDNRIAQNLERYMNEKRPWLNPTLTLQDMAIALNTNRTYLSRYFNNKLGTTFYDYLNNFRVEYASEILLSEPNLSILQVSEKAGFNTLSTFRRTFEKYMGCTPAEYRREKKNIKSL